MTAATPVLFDRFPRLASLPRIPLVTAPTRLERASRLSGFTEREVWVKREDATDASYGGNKVRKLQYLLGDAQAKQATTLLTTGALGSHHALATAIHGGARGFAVHAFLSPQPWTDHVEENLRAHVAVGSTLHRVPSAFLALPAMEWEALKERRARRRPYLIPHGGSNPVGAIGYVEAGLELAAQLDAKEMPEPDAIYVALGSGATAVGLALGLAAGGVEIPIHAVLVTTRLIGHPRYLRRMMQGTLERLRAIEPRFPDIGPAAERMLRVEDAWVSVGYGVVTDEIERVTDLAAADAITLDPTYTAPTVASLMSDAESGRFRRALYIHTLSSADLSPILARGAEAPSWARSFAGAAR